MFRETLNVLLPDAGQVYCRYSFRSGAVYYSDTRKISFSMKHLLQYFTIFHIATTSIITNREKYFKPIVKVFHAAAIYLPKNCRICTINLDTRSIMWYTIYVICFDFMQYCDFFRQKPTVEFSRSAHFFVIKRRYTV